MIRIKLNGCAYMFVDDDIGHNGLYGYVYYAKGKTITFSLENKEIWQEDRLPYKGDWIFLDCIRPHGKDFQLRAYYARFATASDKCKEVIEK